MCQALGLDASDASSLFHLPSLEGVVVSLLPNGELGSRELEAQRTSQ